VTFRFIRQEYSSCPKTLGITPVSSANLTLELLPACPSFERNQLARWQYAPGKPFNFRGSSSPRGTLICPIGGPFCRLPGISWDKVQLLRSRHRQGMLQPSVGESAPIWAFRVANARVELERAQTSLSGETVRTGGKGTARARLQHVARPTLFVLRVLARRRRRPHSVIGLAHIVVCEHRKKERL